MKVRKYGYRTSRKRIAFNNGLKTSPPDTFNLA